MRIISNFQFNRPIAIVGVSYVHLCVCTAFGVYQNLVYAEFGMCHQIIKISRFTLAENKKKIYDQNFKNSSNQSIIMIALKSVHIVASRWYKLIKWYCAIFIDDTNLNETKQSKAKQSIWRSTDIVAYKTNTSIYHFYCGFVKISKLL